MGYLLGIDISTTGAKALLVSESGSLVSSAVSEYPLLTPHPLWAEQEPESWWNACCESIQAALSRGGVVKEEISAVGLTGQMHGSVFCDSEGEVVRPAILWCDQRTAAECEEITEAAGGREAVLEETCNPVLTGFTAPKIAWLRKNEPNNYARVAKVLLPKDYVRLRMTGEYATDMADASGTSLFSVRERRWSQAMLQAAQVPKEWMPRLYEGPDVTGVVSQQGAGATGLAAGTPVVAGGGDQAAGGVGSGIVARGSVSSTIGTSGVVFAFCDEPILDPGGRVHTFCHAVPGKWHVMGVMLSAGGSLRWFRDRFCAEEVAQARSEKKDPYEVMCQEAARVSLGSDGLIFLPYLAGERTPHNDPNARGVFFGITLAHTKGHFIRAILEGVAFGMRDSFEIIKGMSLPTERVRASGGGARSRLWLKIQADVTGFAHDLLAIDEGPAFGAALLAGVGAGVWATVEEACSATVKTIDHVEPIAEGIRAYETLYPIYKDLYRDLEGRFESVSHLLF
jgi:xylulokinase